MIHNRVLEIEIVDCSKEEVPEGKGRPKFYLPKRPNRPHIFSGK